MYKSEWKKNQTLKQSLLLFPMQMDGDLFGDQGGVVAGAVVDDEIDLDFIFCGLVYNLGRILDHLWIQTNYFLKGDPNRLPLQRVSSNHSIYFDNSKVFLYRVTLLSYTRIFP
jgi:hypothetical protein